MPASSSISSLVVLVKACCCSVHLSSLCWLSRPIPHPGVGCLLAPETYNLINDNAPIDVDRDSNDEQEATEIGDSEDEESAKESAEAELGKCTNA